MLRPKGVWYPNQQVENVLSAKFSGSPQPKQFAAGGKLSNMGSDCKSASKRGAFKIHPEQTGSISKFGATRSPRTKFQSMTNVDRANYQKPSFFRGFDRSPKDQPQNPMMQQPIAKAKNPPPFIVSSESASSLAGAKALPNDERFMKSDTSKPKQVPHDPRVFASARLRIDE